MLFIIGPAEEIFWRAYLQKNLSSRWNPNIGFVVTTILYSIVHLSKFNFMLIMAAMVAGFVCGLAYRLFPEKLGAIILSHALWDCAVFIWFPIM
jgi:membrane protease YdiL (CAAX protease family)